jgi:hypothetical protein
MSGEFHISRCISSHPAMLIYGKWRLDKQTLSVHLEDIAVDVRVEKNDTSRRISDSDSHSSKASTKTAIDDICVVRIISEK